MKKLIKRYRRWKLIRSRSRNIAIFFIDFEDNFTRAMRETAKVFAKLGKSLEKPTREEPIYYNPSSWTGRP